MRLLLDLLNFLLPYGIYSYIVAFALLIACGFGLPMPEDIILVTSGILASRRITELWATQLVCFTGVMLGDAIVFTLGRKFGPVIKKKGIFKRIFTEERDRRVMQIFHKYGNKVIFMGRFMPGLRTPIFMSAGTFQVPAWKFFLLDGVAALISVPVWIQIGYWFGQNFEELEEIMRQFQVGLYAVIGFFAALLLGSMWFKRRLLKKNPVL